MEVSLKCPNCGEIVKISEALRREVEEEIKRSLEERVRKELEERTFLEIEDLKRRLSEKEKKVYQLEEQELKLREEKRQIEEKERNLKLELERRLDEERKKIEESILKQAYEEHRLKDLEKDKKIADLQRQLEEALRRASVGSQQLQGEIPELDLEEKLRANFPNDEVQPVEKGVKGADIRQIVKSPRGFVCGTILWEVKRTKAWKEEWTTKLKADLRREKANIPVIVTSIFPKEIKSGFGLYDGVWITSFDLVIPMATILRKNLLDLGYQKVISTHKGEKKDHLYDYITSHEFRQQVEVLVEVYMEMQSELQKERNAFEKIWKTREGQIRRLITSTANVVGSIQGRVGSSVLQIKGLDLPELESGE